VFIGKLENNAKSFSRSRPPVSLHLVKKVGFQNVLNKSMKYIKLYFQRIVVSKVKLFVHDPRANQPISSRYWTISVMQ
jgi:hypothetical protein